MAGCMLYRRGRGPCPLCGAVGVDWSYASIGVCKWKGSQGTPQQGSVSPPPTHVRSSLQFLVLYAAAYNSNVLYAAAYSCMVMHSSMVLYAAGYSSIVLYVAANSSELLYAVPTAFFSLQPSAPLLSCTQLPTALRM